MAWVPQPITDFQEVTRTILEIVKSEYRRSARPISLAALGSQLSLRVGPTPGLKLSDTIRVHLWRELELIRDPQHPEVFSAGIKAPLDATASDLQIAAEDPSNSNTYVAYQNLKAFENVLAPRFDSRFWAAFAKPINPMQKRVITTTYPFTFYDLSQTIQLPEGLLQVENEYIAPSSLVDRTERTGHILRQIEAWLKKYNISADVFQTRREVAVVEPPKTIHVPGFIQLLSQLDSKDLERISIPADIWLKLLRL